MLCLLTVIVVFSCTVHSGSSFACRPGYEAPFKGSNSCYRFDTTGTNWFDAWDSCRWEGAQLVSIETAEEQAHLVWYINSRADLKNTDRYGYWISASDLTKDGNTFVWKATGWALRYKAFYPGEPNGGHREQCVEMRKDCAWRWNDVTCKASNGYICEKHTFGCGSATARHNRQTKE